MHDLNTIIRLNAEAHGDAVDRRRAEGKFVVAKYTGLHLVSFEAYDTGAAALQALNDGRVGASPDVHFKLYNPTLVPRGRDQSEDRTLADYIARKA